jgi:hypothetical protein
MVNASLLRRLALEPRHADQIRSACNERGENAEGTRDAQEPWRVQRSRCGRRTWRDRALAATGSSVGDDARDALLIPVSAEPRVSPGRNDVTEGTREPQECWGTYRWEEVLQSGKGAVAP